jgi:hypothetical protein
MNGLLGSSYISPDRERIVSVYVNTASTMTSRTVSLSGLTDRKPLTVHKYVTDVTHNLALVPSQSGAYKGDRITFPARSVVTVVYDLAGPSTVMDEDCAYNAPEKTVAAPLVELRRTLDTSWNALCLPVSLTAEQVTSVFGEGAVVAHYTGFNGGDIQFSTANQCINANEPVIIKLTKAADSFYMQNVSISASTLPDNTVTYSNNGESVSLKGIYQPISNLYVSRGGTNDVYGFIEDKLLKADATSNISCKGFNAFISVENPTATKTTVTVDGVATAIKAIKTDVNISGDVYDLSGRLVGRNGSLNALRKGIYIVNGKKVIVR